MTTLPTATNLEPELHGRLQGLWQRTGAPLLGQLLAGTSPLAAPGDRQDRRPHELVCTCLMAAHQETGDPEALALLFELTSAEFLRVIRRLLRSGPGLDPQDALQEAFLNLCRYPGRFVADRADAFHRWAHRIVRNTVFALVARERRQPAPWPDGEVVPPADGREPPPERRFTERESAAHVDRAYVLYLALYLAGYERLGERDRRMLFAAEVEQRSYRDIAAEFGVRACTVKMAIFRIRRRLQQHLARLLAAIGGPVAAVPAPA
ncbi:MAG: RNA polymerase sigma factor [Planctomycetes bacterium]|nr:RNA polymerase sigma factor [Planctomycetota bacterium]